MATQGPNSTGSGNDDSGVGTISWVNPNNVTANDAGRATAALTAANPISHYLKANSFGFSIPSGATINGFVVEVLKDASGTLVKDYRVRIGKGGIVGATAREDTTTDWPTTEAYVTYGSSSDLWGETWTDGEVNSAAFAIFIAANDTAGANRNARINHIRITVHYTALDGRGREVRRSQVAVNRASNW